MKLRFFFAALAAAAFATTAQAQLPSHAKYVLQSPNDNSMGFFDYLKAWNENNPKVTDDDNFYIARVRKAERFVDTSTQVDPTMTQDRKMFWWCPAGVANSYWSSLPRYIYNADAFSMWSMLDIHGNWADGWARVPGAFTDAAHKNGVENGCIIFFEGSAGTQNARDIFNYLGNSSNNYANCRKFVRFLKYYGIDGLGVNPEGSLGSSAASSAMTALEKLHQIAAEEGWSVKIHWYDAQTNTGSVSWANQLGPTHVDWFQRTSSQYPVSDVYFLNYNWYSSHLATSKSTATGRGRSSYDVYAGFDIQGRAIYGSYGGASDGWVLLANNPISVGIWGAHGKNMLYENANEYGSDATSVQNLYQKKQEQFFGSGTRNYANAPQVTNRVRSFGYNSMKNFHGMTRFVPARSVLNKLPFITYFNLGNGKYYNVEGQRVNNREWYNLGVQDIMPTWRWWIVDGAGHVPAQQIEAEMSSEDAWMGGSCMKFSGATSQSIVRLYKTNFQITGNEIVTLRYKLPRTQASSMQLHWSNDGTSYKTYPVPAAQALGEWCVLQVPASTLGMSGLVREIGLTFNNTSADYVAYIGEFSIVDGKSYSPAKPTITKAEICGARYNAADIKLIWKSKEPNASKPWEPIYNDEVDTWYFEVYSQLEGGEPRLETTTTSWAAYVVGVDMTTDLSKKVRYGVCAVAPDGKTRSEIAWSSYEARSSSNLTISEEVSVDKAVIKPNEQFTVSFDDPLHAAATWQIKNVSTGAVVFTQSNKKSITTSIANLGTYDVVVGTTTFPGLIQITPEATGAVPQIATFAVDKTQAEVAEPVTATLTVKRLGEGKVSRGVVIEDPTMLRFSSSMCNSPEFTFAMWIKPTNWAHGKYGTNLFNKRDWAGSWPHNNWGTLWMHIWPDVEVYSAINPNIVSLTYFNSSDGSTYGSGNVTGNGNKHESPNNACMANDLSLTLDQWYHVAFSVSNSKMSLFLNGKRVGTQNISWSGLNRQNGCSATQYCYVGGTNTYHGGFIGVVDDVQYWDVYTENASDFLLDAMQGFSGRTIPAHLKGYWDFEDAPIVGSKAGVTSKFKNLGKDASLEAETMFLKGASGENPDANITTATFLEADNNIEGNPGIPGSIDIKTKTVWDLPQDATGVENGNSNAVTFRIAGQERPITARLENRWGYDERTINVVIKNVTGIEGVNVENEKPIELNYTSEGITALFQHAGAYQIAIVSMDGRTIQQQNLTTSDAEVVNFTLDAPAGTYLITVRGQNGSKQTLKVHKR